MISRKKMHHRESKLSIIRSTYNMKKLEEIYCTTAEEKSAIKKQKIRILKRTNSVTERNEVIENKEASLEELVGLSKNPYCSVEEMKRIMYHENFNDPRIYLKWLNKQNAKEIKRFIDSKKDINLQYLGENGNDTVKNILIQDSRIDKKMFNQLIQEGDTVRQEKALKNANMRCLLNLSSILAVIRNTYNIQVLEEIESGISNGRLDTVEVRAVIKKKRECLLQRTNSYTAVREAVESSNTSINELVALSKNPYCSVEGTKKIMYHRNFNEPRIYLNWLNNQNAREIKRFIRSKNDIDLQYLGEMGSETVKNILIQDERIDSHMFNQLMQGDESRRNGLKNPNIVAHALDEKANLDIVRYILKNASYPIFYEIYQTSVRRRELKVLNLILEREIWDRLGEDKKKQLWRYNEIVQKVISTEDYEKGNNTELIIDIYIKIYSYICEQYGSWWNAGEKESYDVYELGKTMIERLPSNTNMHERITVWNERYEIREKYQREYEKRASILASCDSYDFLRIEKDYIRNGYQPRRSWTPLPEGTSPLVCRKFRTNEIV